MMPFTHELLGQYVGAARENAAIFRDMGEFDSFAWPGENHLVIPDHRPAAQRRKADLADPTQAGVTVARTLGKSKYCLLRGHDSVVAVNSIPEVFLDSLEMEENARSTVHASTLGKLLPITPEEVELLKVSFARNTYRIAKTWEHYQEKARLTGHL